MERLEQAKGRMYAYRYAGDDCAVPDHRLCAPCWNAKRKTMILHEYVKGGKPTVILQCPRCDWKTGLGQVR